MASITLDYLMNIQVYTDGVTNTLLGNNYNVPPIKSVVIAGTDNPFLINFSDMLDYTVGTLPTTDGSYIGVATQFTVRPINPSYPNDPMLDGAAIDGVGFNSIYIVNKGGVLYTKFATQLPETTVLVTLAKGTNYRLGITHSTIASGGSITAYSQDRYISVTEIKR